MQKNQKGSTLTELIMVMLLLVIFGMSISWLIYSGGRAQERIISERNSQIDARIAISYLNMVIRQNDAAGRVSIRQNEITGENSIFIKENIDLPYDMWIYWADGYIYECFISPGGQPEIGLSQRIAEVDWFFTEMNGGLIVNTIGYTVNGAEMELTGAIFLRSGL